MADRSPFHVGEQQVQSRLGVRDVENWARKVVRSFMPDEHRAFHPSLPFLVAAARDQPGRPWATLLVGPDGFVESPDPGTLRIGAEWVPGDALEGALRSGADLGLLGIELATRRRNRVNGRLGDAGDVLLFQVEQSFGNCPQYIHERDWRRVEGEVPGAPKRATYGMDASHRGGNPGFVTLDGDRRLLFPDYAGNNHFNTIGNLTLDPRVGLLFVDFASGGMLQIAGRAEITWDGLEVERSPAQMAIEISGRPREQALQRSLHEGPGESKHQARFRRKRPAQ